MSRATGRHTRPKKLNPKQNVQIFREEQVEIIEYDSAHATIETGVEKNEESVSFTLFDPLSLRPIRVAYSLSHLDLGTFDSRDLNGSPQSVATADIVHADHFDRNIICNRR